MPLIILRLEKQDDMPSVNSVKINHQYIIKIKNIFFWLTVWMHLCHLFLNKSITKSQQNAFVLKTFN